MLAFIFNCQNTYTPGWGAGVLFGMFYSSIHRVQEETWNEAEQKSSTYVQDSVRRRLFHFFCPYLSFYLKACKLPCWEVRNFTWKAQHPSKHPTGTLPKVTSISSLRSLLLGARSGGHNTCVITEVKDVHLCKAPWHTHTHAYTYASSQTLLSATHIYFLIVKVGRF